MASIGFKYAGRAAMTPAIIGGFAILQMGIALAAPDIGQPGVRLDVPFTLGPYARDMLPTPVAATLDAAAIAGSLSVEERNAAGATLARYPGYRMGGQAGSESRGMVFVPWSAEHPAAWPAGTERHFVVRDTEPETPATASGFVHSTADTLILSNRHYVITLAPVSAPQTGPATIIRSIVFGSSGKMFRPGDCHGELNVDGKRYFTRFDPATPPRLVRAGPDVVAVTYAGGYHDGHEALPGVAWRMTLTGYAELPLINVRMERRQTPEALAAGRCTFQAFLKMTFNGRDPSRHPFKTVRPIFRSSFDQNRDLVAAEGPDACLAILLPDGRTFGTCYYVPEHTGYAFLCMEHESQHTIRSQHYRPELDVREGYLLATSDTTLADRLIDAWWSLHQMIDVNERLRLRRLFERRR